MKINTSIIKTILTFAVVSCSTCSLADDIKTIEKRSHPIQQDIKNMTLLDITNQLTGRTGIRFKIDAGMESDIVNQKLIADDWHTALNQLLVGYNYAINEDGHQIKAVMISGRSGAVDEQVLTALEAKLFPEEQLLVNEFPELNRVEFPMQ